jgi:tight adherence protein B
MSLSTATAVALAAAAGFMVAGRPNVLEARLGHVSGTRAARAARTRPVSIVALVQGRLTSRRRMRQREVDVTDACLALAANLRAGMPVAQAVEAVGDGWPELFGRAAGTAAVGGDVAAAFRMAAKEEGAGALAAVAAGCEVSERTGASLSRVLMAIADSLRMAAVVRREAESQLATARTTARLLAVLPVGTLFLMSGGDRSSIEFLLTTPIGLACLAGAALFTGAGLWWVRRVARSVMESAWER